MRRKDFEGQAEEIAHIFSKAETGQLGMTDPEGFPRAVPVNFAWDGSSVYFHGATSGEKYSAFLSGPKTTFTAYVQYSYLPSYWRSAEYSCTASILYKSASVKGRGTLVEDEAEKAMAINLLMEKYQPEGGYKMAAKADPLYKKGFSETAIFKITADSVTVKNKMGQNLTPEARKTIIEKLNERGTPLDLLTALEIARSAPGC